jgi:hypothetical protein
MNTNTKGTVAELQISANLTEQGHLVYRPLTEGLRHDLLVVTGTHILKVQCKYVKLRDEGTLYVPMSTTGESVKGYYRKPYSEQDCHVVAAYCPDTGDCYYVSNEDEKNRNSVVLRVTPPKNGQKQGIRWAKDYTNLPKP